MVKESSFQKFVLNYYIEFMGQNFGGRAGEFFCENRPGAALMSETIPAGSRMDSLLVKAGAISKAGGFSMIICLEKCIKCCAAAVREKTEKKMRGATLLQGHEHQGHERKDQEGCFRHQSRNSPATMEDHVGTDIHS